MEENKNKKEEKDNYNIIYFTLMFKKLFIDIVFSTTSSN